MKKFIILMSFVLVFSVCSFAQTAAGERVFTVEITNIAVNGGKVYLAIFSNAEEFRKEEPKYLFELQDTRTAMSQEVSLPLGEYVITAFQDANNNKQMEYNFLGIPRESFGITNWDGRGFPSRNFNNQKITVNNTTGRITIGLFKL